MSDACDVVRVMRCSVGVLSLFSLVFAGAPQHHGLGRQQVRPSHDGYRGAAGAPPSMGPAVPTARAPIGAPGGRLVAGGLAGGAWLGGSVGSQE